MSGLHQAEAPFLATVNAFSGASVCFSVVLNGFDADRTAARPPMCRFRGHCNTRGGAVCGFNGTGNVRLAIMRCFEALRSTARAAVRPRHQTGCGRRATGIPHGAAKRAGRAGMPGRGGARAEHQLEDGQARCGRRKRRLDLSGSPDRKSAH
jgi:hypothetical protein